MRPTRHVTTLLLVAAFATANCSKSGEALHAEAGAAESAAKSVAATEDSSKRVSEALASDVIPKLTPTVAFSDGEAAYKSRKYREATAIFEHYIAQRPNNAW